jgi:hypothetical protein
MLGEFELEVFKLDELGVVCDDTRDGAQVLLLKLLVVAGCWFRWTRELGELDLGGCALEWAGPLQSRGTDLNLAHLDFASMRVPAP